MAVLRVFLILDGLVRVEEGRESPLQYVNVSVRGNISMIVLCNASDTTGCDRRR